VALFAATAHSGPTNNAPFIDFERDLRQICGTSPDSTVSRVVGSSGYQRTGDYLQKQFASITAAHPNVVEAPPQNFEVMAPQTESASATIVNTRTSFPIFPFWPAQVRVDSTPAAGVRGRLIYVGDGHVQQIYPAKLRGQIAVIDAAGGYLWHQAFYFGASAVLILGAPDSNNVDLRTHDLDVPVNFPRFYVPPGRFADAIRSGSITGDVVLDVNVQWKEVVATNYYVLVKPKSAPADRGASINPAAVVIAVPYESSGLVPDLAVGAGQAVNTAAGLFFLRHAVEHPLDRPILFFFGGCDSIQFRATREMLMAFADPPDAWNAELNDKDSGINAAVCRTQSDILRLKEVLNDPSKLDATRDDELLDRVARLIEADIRQIQDQLAHLRIQAAKSGSPLDSQADVLETRREHLSDLRYSLQRRPDSLRHSIADNFDQFSAAVEYLRRELNCLEGDGKPGQPDHVPGLLEQQQEKQREVQFRVILHRWLTGQLDFPVDGSDRNDKVQLIDLLVGIDLSDGGFRVGPLAFGQFEKQNAVSMIQNYKDWFAEVVEGSSARNDPRFAWFGPLRGVLDLLDPVSNRRSPASWLCASMPTGSEMAWAWGLPGFSMVTLDDLRLKRDTPADTLDLAGNGEIVSPNLKVIEPQLDAVQQLFWHAWSGPRFETLPRFSLQHTSLSGQVVGYSSDRPTPDLPRQGFLATYCYISSNSAIVTPAPLPWTMGVRRCEVQDCDNEGFFRFDGIAKIDQMNNLAVQAFRIKPADRGKISGAINANSEISSHVDTRSDIAPVSCVAFDCDEFSLDGLYDPRFLQDLNQVLLIDARRNDVPNRFNGVISNQMMAGFAEPGSTLCLVFRYGQVGNRLMLLNMPELTSAHPQVPASDRGAGFDLNQISKLHPISLISTNDFYQINDYRLRKYKAAGVVSSLIDDLHAASLKNFTIARAQYMGTSTDTGSTAATIMASANLAWADEARVYSAESALANDVVRGAMFLLFLCAPFSFCMERLLISTSSIYKQITYTFGIFLLMTMLLWSFHPAFKISTSPLVVILAFAIIFMSTLVIGMIYGKFNSELGKLRMGRGAASNASFARASVLVTAALIGIANMRKRKFRTALTSLTIVLITFAVLCFASASTVIDTISLPISAAPTAPSLMLRQRGFRPMSAGALESLSAALPGRTLVQRWWNINALDPSEDIHVVMIPSAHADRGPAIFSSPAILGLSPGEGRLSKIAGVIGTHQFSRLENGEEHIVYLCGEIARQLGAKENDWVTIGGIPLQIAGIFSARQFDSQVSDLDGEMISPLDYSQAKIDSQGQALNDNKSGSFYLDGGVSASELENTYEHLSSTSFVIVPAAISRLLPNASLRSVGIPLDSDAQVKPISADLARRFAAAIFAGNKNGVSMISASDSLPRVSGGLVAVPLVIAGMIIFNTMLGSVAERKREIHVYTSLGLAPLHVGAMFLTEAMTYGVIGTVSGYIIGQGVGTLLNHYHLLGKVTLNYSGTSAMLTMGLILLIILLSALVPARLASKIASPSIDRHWKVPAPDGDEIFVSLPFTINKTAADGTLAYLSEFFEMHREGSLGKFSCGEIEPFALGGKEQGSGRGLNTMIWLTPFDLGVRQRLTLLIHPGQYPDIYEVEVTLKRISGDNDSWWRMNRRFLTELRKEFLQWRSLPSERMLHYVRESKKLFTFNSDHLLSIASDLS